MGDACETMGANFWVEERMWKHCLSECVSACTTIHESTLEPRRRTRLLVSRDAVHHSPLSEPSSLYNILEVKSAKVSVSSWTHVVL